MKVPHDQSATLSSDWHRWLLRNLIDGVEHSLICEALAGREIDKDTVQRWIETTETSTEYRTLKALTRRMRQTRQHLVLRRRLNALKPEVGKVRERDEISATDFFQDYYFENRPLVLRGYANHWPARRKWTPEWIKTTYGHVQVKVTDDRNSNPDYDMQHQVHTRSCSLGDYADRVMSNNSGNDTYMVANNRNIENPELSPLLADVDYDTAIFEPTRWRSCSAFLWRTPTRHRAARARREGAIATSAARRARRPRRRPQQR